MKTGHRAGGWILTSALSWILTWTGSLVAIASVASAAERPNIILMLADDQGWDGLSVAMAPDAPGSRGQVFHTPNLEKFAAQGMRFSNAYAPAPVCSPTRISLQTGRSPAALHWTKAAPPEPGHKLREPTLIKQIAAFGGDLKRLDTLVPPEVIAALEEKRRDPRNPLGCMAIDGAAD